MSLTKTQIEILAEAAANRHGAVCVSCGHQGGKRFGLRRFAAVCALRDAGLLVLVETHRFAETRRGFTTLSGNESLWNITDAGRVVLAA